MAGKGFVRSRTKSISPVSILRSRHHVVYSSTWGRSASIAWGENGGLRRRRYCVHSGGSISIGRNDVGGGGRITPVNDLPSLGMSWRDENRWLSKATRVTSS